MDLHVVGSDRIRPHLSQLENLQDIEADIVEELLVSYITNGDIESGRLVPILLWRRGNCALTEEKGDCRAPHCR